MYNKEEIDNINSMLLEKLAKCLNEHSDCVTTSDINLLCKNCSIDKESAFKFLFASCCSFDVEKKEQDKFVFENYFPEMIKCLDADEFRNNPYYKNISIQSTRLGNWNFEWKKYKPYEAFVCDDMERFKDGRVIPAIGFFDEEFLYPCVLENGREWMLVTPNEINTMKQPIGNAFGKVLTFGLGLGYFAYMVHMKKSVSEVYVVEKDKQVIELFEKFILPQFKYKDKIKVINADAFEYAKKQMLKEKFDYVFVDIWHDVADGFDLYFKFKEMAKNSPNMKFDYWIEKTIKCYE